MKKNDFTWMIGGEAGFGIQSAGHIFALGACRGGLHVFGEAEYPSLIRGGHNSDVIRIADREVMVHKEQLDLLCAMNKETLDLHAHEIVEGGGAIYDPDEVKDFVMPDGVKAFPVPLGALAKEHGGSSLYRNTVGIGASFGLVKYDLEILNEILKDMFGRKGDEIVNNNIAVAKAGYDFVMKNFADGFEYVLEKVEGAEKKMMITGNDALCFGALKAGCKFVAEYPMTPSTSILHFMAKHAKDYHVVVKHTEDELAAMNMVVGASWAGARAMTATSGGGFCLMVEALGMAGMIEAPIVCVEVQRAGPSTGLPTRTEQGDLLFVNHASQGEFPRVVMAPGDFEQCFRLAFDAFNLAEKYQLPVLILSDKHLAESVKSMVPFKTEGMKVDRGKLLTQEQLDKMRAESEKVLAGLPDGGTLKDKGHAGASVKGNYISPDNGFLRYKYEEDGVSPRTIPGMKGGIHRSATDEHDETGDLTEDPAERTMMMDKRMRKLEGVLAELPAPVLQGEADADITFVTWGSPKDAVLELIELLAEDGIKANLLQIVYMVPFHAKEIGDILKGCKKTVAVEMNATGQLCELIAQKTGYFVDEKILKYSGRQFTAHEIHDRVKELIKK